MIFKIVQLKDSENTHSVYSLYSLSPRIIKPSKIPKDLTVRNIISIISRISQGRLLSALIKNYLVKRNAQIFG